MKCLNCEKDFTAKRVTAKYCSDNCRVKSFLKREKKSEKVTEVKLNILYNSLLEMVGKINTSTLPNSYDSTKKDTSFIDEPPQYIQPKNKFNQAYFERIIMNGGCEEPEDHKMFIETVNESELSDFIKKQLINSSRVKQS